MIRDEEDLIKSLRDYVKTNLNANIIIINQEKEDFDLDVIPQDNDHFVLAGEVVELPNHTFCQIAIAGEIGTKNNANDIVSFPNILVEVAFDNPKKANTYFRSLRYMRAIYQTIINFESSVLETDGLQITKVIPAFITTTNRQFVVSGVEMSMALGW